MLDWPLYTPSPNRECLYKVASPGKTPEKHIFTWNGHFIPPPPTENASIKWPVQVKPLKKHMFTWNGHFIPPPPTENASIKLPVQVKPLKKHIFTWNGHFIPQPVGSRTLTRKRKGWQQGKGGKLQRRGTTGRLPQENETCHVYIRLLFSMCHIDWRWLVYWICCRCILEHMYTYDSHININIYINHKHMPNQKLLAEYCIPNLLANVQPIHHAWPNKIQTMDCLISKKNTGSCKQFYRGWAWTGQFIQRVGLPEMTWSNHFIELNFLANHFIEDGHVAVVLAHRCP